MPKRNGNQIARRERGTDNHVEPGEDEREVWRRESEKAHERHLDIWVTAGPDVDH